MNPIIKTTIVLFPFLFNACKPKDPGNEGELITTIKITLTDSVGLHTFQWKDPDGPGGNNPTVDSIMLKSGRTYSGKIELLDESKSPTFDVTAEIEKEKDVHQFFYTASATLNGRIGITVQDKDSKNLPVGLSYSLTTVGSGDISGSIKVVLSHYDGIAKTASPSPESDVDIDWPVRLE